MILKEYSKVISTGIALGALTYQAGKQSEKIENILVRTVNAETKIEKQDSILYDIHGRICSIEKDIKNILDKINK